MTEAMHSPDPDLDVETARNAVAQVLDALRAVRLYTLRHPVSSQALARSHQRLIGILSHGKPFCIELAGPDVLFRGSPLVFGDPSHASMISDLTGIGVRGIDFLPGLTTGDLERFFAALALPAEELTRLGGLPAVLAQQGCDHIVVTERSAAAERGPSASVGETMQGAGAALKSGSFRADKRIRVSGADIEAGDILRDPVRFGNMVVDRSGGKAGRAKESFLSAARQMIERPDEAGPALTALAQAVAAADRRLGGDLLRGLRREADQGLLAVLGTTGGSLFSAGSALELLSARPGAAAEQDAAGFLRSLGTLSVPADSRASGWTSRPRPEPDDLAKQLVLSPEETASLRDLCSERPEAFDRPFLVRSLTSAFTELRQQSDSGAGGAMADPELLVGRLESLARDCIAVREFVEAEKIIALFGSVSEPLIAPHAARVIKALAEKGVVAQLVRATEAARESNPARTAVMAILSRLGSEVTPVLLEMLAAEPDRSPRMVLIRILKDLGKDQIALLGARLSDERWYFVRNIVTILGESRKEEAVACLATAAQHRNFQVRQEVVKALVAIGGEQAADLLVRFLNDRDVDIRFMAVRGLGAIGVAGHKQERALIECTRGGWFRKNDLDLRREAVSSLGMIGGWAAAEYLKTLASRPVKGRAEREALAAAARIAVERISGRVAHG